MYVLLTGTEWKKIYNLQQVQLVLKQMNKYTWLFYDVRGEDWHIDLSDYTGPWGGLKLQTLDVFLLVGKDGKI